MLIYIEFRPFGLNLSLYIILTTQEASWGVFSTTQPTHQRRRSKLGYHHLPPITTQIWATFNCLGTCRDDPYQFLDRDPSGLIGVVLPFTSSWIYIELRSFKLNFIPVFWEHPHFFKLELVLNYFLQVIAIFISVFQRVYTSCGDGIYLTMLELYWNDA